MPVPTDSSGNEPYKPDRSTRRGFLKEAATIVSLATGYAPFHAIAWSKSPILASQDAVFLREQARRIVASARLNPGEIRGKWRNETQYTLHVPSGDMGYPAFWVRDAVMMLGADLISLQELEGWIRFMAKATQGPEESVHPTGVVPPYMLPDHIRFDGTPEFFPGTYPPGSPQPQSKRPPLDNNFYFISAVYSHWKLAGSQFFLSLVDTSSEKMKLADFTERAYKAPSFDPVTGLVAAGDINKQNAKDWGFCDTIFKSGKLLFPSVLKVIAARQLAEIFSAQGQAQKARKYSLEASKICKEIQSTFFHMTSKDEGWLHSATGACNQPDVWGSAFAVWADVVEGTMARGIGRSLVRAYRTKTAVQQGCVRQILTTDSTNHGGWEETSCPLGEYQNGGYWGTPTGWYISAIAGIDRKAAAEMAHDYIRFLQSNMGADGTTQAQEWFSPEPLNPPSKHPAKALYVATVGLPYLSMKASRLI